MFNLKPPRHISTLPFATEPDLCLPRSMSALVSTATALARAQQMTRRAKKRLMHCSNYRHYSITSSAVSRIDGGTVRPSAFAVFRLMTIRYFIGN